MLWYGMDYAKERVKGTFINGNHFAACMAMAVMLAAAFACAVAPLKDSSRNRSNRGKTLGSRMAAFLENEQALSKRILVVLSGGGNGLGIDFFRIAGGHFELGRCHVSDGCVVDGQKGISAKRGLFLSAFFF